MLRLESSITTTHCNISELTSVEHTIMFETREAEDAIEVEHLHQGLREYHCVGKLQPWEHVYQELHSLEQPCWPN